MSLFHPIQSPGLLFSSVTIFSETVGLFWANVQPVARPLPKHRTTQTQDKSIHTPNIHALSWIRTYDPSVRESDDSSCLRPLGYCDRLQVNIPHAISFCYGLRYSLLAYDSNNTDSSTLVLSRCRLTTISQLAHGWLTSVRARVRITLRLAVYCQSVRLGFKSLEDHNIFYSTEPLRS
jgi:hypothetical protein